MDKEKVIEFFDGLAPGWDAELIKDGEKIARILDAAGIGEGSSVLDVACGTGVLIPDYLARGVSGVTGVDISEGMIEIARAKFSDPRAEFIRADVEEYEFDKRFDAVVVYNALPHFPDPARLLSRLGSLLLPGGRLTIAHGRGREAINAHHAGAAREVSMGLMSAKELAALFPAELEADVIVSESGIYIVSGRRIK